MSVDGFSMSSLGLPKDITSAQMAASTEQAVLNAGEKVVGKIDKVLNKRIDNNTDDEKEKNQFFEDGFQKDEEDEDEENEENEENAQHQSFLNTDEEFKDGIEKKKRKYKAPVIKDPENITIRFNNDLNNIELYNIVTNKTVESIQTEEFVSMVNKLDYNSGILLNKNI